jgi:hypothetical protein
MILTYLYAATFSIGSRSRRSVCLPLEYGCGAWENKDKVKNCGHNDSDCEDKDCLDGYHKDNNTTDKL